MVPESQLCFDRSIDRVWNAGISGFCHLKVFWTGEYLLALVCVCAWDHGAVAFSIWIAIVWNCKSAGSYRSRTACTYGCWFSLSPPPVHPKSNAPLSRAIGLTCQGEINIVSSATASMLGSPICLCSRPRQISYIYPSPRHPLVVSPLETQFPLFLKTSPCHITLLFGMVFFSVSAVL